MKVNTSIKYMDYFIPSNTIEVDEILSLNKNSPVMIGRNYNEFVQQFKEQSRIEIVSAFDPKDNLAGIISNMVDKLFETTGIKPSEITYLVCGNPVLMEGNISVVHYIHKKFKLEDAVIIPMFQPCAATTMAMGLSEKLLSTKEKKYILVLSARKAQDVQGRFMGFSMIGDGISLVLIENRPGDMNITNWLSFNNGESSYNKMDAPDKIKDIAQLQMDIIKNGVKFLQKSMSKMNIRMEDIDVIIHPNTNYQVWHKIYPSLLNINPGIFHCENIWNGGHMNDVDLVRNAKDYIEKNKENKRSMKLLIYAIDLILSQDINYQMVSLDIKV